MEKTRKNKKPKLLSEYPFPKCNMDCNIALTRYGKSRMHINRVCPIHTTWFREIVGEETWSSMMKAGKELDR